ncbi:putative PTH11-typeG-protein-coupled receptor [Trichoderma sp. SZMC 28013]
MATPEAPIIDLNESDSLSIYIPSAVFIVICPIMVLLRVLDRKRRKRTGIDDWTAVAASVRIAYNYSNSLLIVHTRYGMGRHSAYISDKNKCEIFKFSDERGICSTSTYKLTINFSKVSILRLYLRIFESYLWMKRTCWGLIVCVAMYCLSSTAATVFQCDPIPKAFDKAIPGTCINLAKFWFANAEFSIATDIFILALPIPIVYTLQSSWSRKIALVLVFAVGIVVVIASCLRATTIDIFAISPDNTYDLTNVMCTIIESSLALICSSLQPLGRWIKKCMTSENSRSGEDIPMDAVSTAGGDVRALQSDDLEAAHISGSHLNTRAADSLSSGSEERILSLTHSKDEEVIDGISQHANMEFTQKCNMPSN